MGIEVSFRPRFSFCSCSEEGRGRPVRFFCGVAVGSGQSKGIESRRGPTAKRKKRRACQYDFTRESFRFAEWSRSVAAAGERREESHARGEIHFAEGVSEFPRGQQQDLGDNYCI
jgi:hypothetical protein